MRRFKNILALYNRKVGDEAALHRAAALAKMNDARLTVAEAVEKLPRDVVALLGSPLGGQTDIQRRFLEERQAGLEHLASVIREDGVAVETSVLLGRPFLEVIRAVLRDHHDLVVMTADVWQGLHQITFGSTSMHLMRKCPCPVWVMQPTAGRRFQRILAAVDPGDPETDPDALDLKILQLASSLAALEPCHLDVLHAWDFSGADLDTSRSEISDENRAKLVERNKSMHEAALNGLLDQVDLSGVDLSVHLPRGNPALLIPQFVFDNKVDLIVMGTLGRSGIAGLFIGNTAEYVLRQVECSVLTVKPDGFVTPVTLEDPEFDAKNHRVMPRP